MLAILMTIAAVALIFGVLWHVSPRFRRELVEYNWSPPVIAITVFMAVPVGLYITALVLDWSLILRAALIVAGLVLSLLRDRIAKRPKREPECLTAL